MKKNILIASLLLLCVSTQAQMIGATNNQRVSRPSNNTGFQKGSNLRFSAGYPILGSVAYIYKFNPYFSFGGGAGIDFPGEQIQFYEKYWYGDEYMHDVGEIGGSLFGEVEINIPLSKKTDLNCFINTKFAVNLSYYESKENVRSDGYSVITPHPYTAILTVGAKYRDFHWGVGMSTAYWFGGFFSYDIHL